MRPHDSRSPEASGSSPEPERHDTRTAVLACWKDLCRAEARLLALRHDRSAFRRAVRAGDSVSAALAVLCREFPVVAVQELVDAEIQQEQWHHPRQVLRLPWPDLGRVLFACELALDDAPPEMRPHLEAVVAKVARAYELDRAAGERLEQLRG